MSDLITFTSMYLAGYIFAETQNFVIFLSGWIIYLLFKRYKLDVRLLVIAFMLAAVGFAFKFGNDPALIATWQQLGQGAILPYGFLWRWANPFWWTDFYQYVAVGWAAAGVVLMWAFGVRRRVFGWGWVIFGELLDLVLIQSQNPQGVFPVMFIFLAPIFLPILAGFFFAKLPLGFPTSSNEWQCVFGGYQYTIFVHTAQFDYYVPVCDRYSPNLVANILKYPSLIFGASLYTLQALIMAYVVWHWYVGPWFWPRFKARYAERHVCECGHRRIVHRRGWLLRLGGCNWHNSYSSCLCERYRPRNGGAY